MRKLAYSVQMSHEVSDDEKQQAEKAMKAFNVSLKLLSAATNHLDIMFIPFKDHPDISTEQIMKFRAALRRFRDKSIENFNEFKIGAFQCFTLMNVFASDTQTLKLIKSFINSIEDIEKYVNEFSELFNNLDSATFVPDIIKIIEIIHKEADELEETIDERIKTHIQKNIIGKTWIDNVGKELSVDVKKTTPIMMDLLKSLVDGKSKNKTKK